MNKQINYIDLVKSSFIIRWSNYIAHTMLLMAVLLLVSGLYMGLFMVETDTQQGEHFRIIYIHVPSAWCCIFLYTVLTIISVIFIVSTHPTAFTIARIISSVGALFTLITLVTGSLWGYPMWGTFWVWDARLTSVLVLFFIYLIHLLIAQKNINDLRNNKIASFVAIIGFVNIPIIKYSVEWWTTLHQGPSIAQFKTTVDPAILQPMLLVFISFVLCTLSILFYNLKKDILTKRINIMHVQ